MPWVSLRVIYKSKLRATRKSRVQQSGVSLTLSGDISAIIFRQVVTGTPQLLVADGLSNTFDGARFQFEELQLTVCRGQKLGLVGINGCGKSTLLKVGGARDMLL